MLWKKSKFWYFKISIFFVIVVYNLLIKNEIKYIINM